MPRNVPVGILREFHEGVLEGIPREAKFFITGEISVEILGGSSNRQGVIPQRIPKKKL